MARARSCCHPAVTQGRAIPCARGYGDTGATGVPVGPCWWRPRPGAAVGALGSSLPITWGARGRADSCCLPTSCHPTPHPRSARGAPQPPTAFIVLRGQPVGAVLVPEPLPWGSQEVATGLFPLLATSEKSLGKLLAIHRGWDALPRHQHPLLCHPPRRAVPCPASCRSLGASHNFPSCSQMQILQRDGARRCAPPQDRGIKVPRQLGRGPSAFIPLEEILQEGVESSRRQLLIEAFVSAGRVDNITMVMGLHPQYLSSFWKTQYLLLRMDGPLPYHKRHYIAIMAAARHQCSYLVGLHMGEFLQVGGNPAWLQGLHCAPQKLRNLNEINKLLAHRPWLITKEHIEALLKTGEHSWSLAELVQALVLLTHYHSLASFVFGCGINPEAEQDGGHGARPPSPHGDSSLASEDSMGCSGGKDALQEVEALMERMKLLQESQQEEEGVTQEEMATRFELEKTESLLVAPSDLADHSLQSSVLCFVEDPEFGYKDFTRRGEQAPPTFRAQDYTWEDHGYSLINRLYPDVGQLLDEKFQVVYNLTYNTIAMHCGVDTSMLRRAIWNYVHCVFGIRYDDYDYGEVNQLLERSLKIYIKTVACYPEKTTKRMYAQFWRHFKHSEKVHINLLLLEARMQAALLYALRAVTRYMT